MVSVNGDRLSLQPSTTMAVAASDPAEARKRRKEIIQSQRTEGNEPTSTTESSPPAAAAAAASAGDAASVEDAASPPASAPATKDKKPPKKRKVVEEDLKDDDDESQDSNSKKAQIRYDPDVPMSKEQLAAWRREARRVRNRESAAASRQRIRSRITELEDEVGEWKDRYTEAMQRLQRLEQTMTSGSSKS